MNWEDQTKGLEGKTRIIVQDFVITRFSHAFDKCTEIMIPCSGNCTA